MTSKIPADAFDYYVSQGEQRSYQATADHFGVSKCAVAKRAKREDWAGRLASIESNARAISDRKLTESIADMQERHLKMAKAMGARALTALRDYPIEDGMDAVRAAELVIKLERMLAGDTAKRNERSIEEITRHEIRTLLMVVPDEEPKPRVVEAVTAGSGAGLLIDDDDDEDEAEEDEDAA
jgi:hypothetical protein